MRGFAGIYGTGSLMLVKCDPIPLGHETPFSATVEVRDDLFDLSNLTLTVSQDYYARFGRPAGETQTLSAREYFRIDSERGRGEALHCQEMPIPRALLPCVTLSVSGSASWNGLGVAYIHAGRRGCTTPVHFDWDVSWVAHVCLTGRKRLFFFPPEAGWLLTPVLNMTALCIPKFSTADRLELLQRLGGIEIVLNAGEGVLFPSMSWHGVLYEEPSLSASMRFEHRVGGRPFAALPRSWLLQRIVWRFFFDGWGSDAREFLGRYVNVLFAQSRTWQERYVRVRDLCRRFLLAHGEERGANVLVGDNFSTELALASDVLQWYYTPSAGASTRSNKLTGETVDYIFEGLRVPPYATRLAAQALRLKQGLRPARGVIEVGHH